MIPSKARCERIRVIRLQMLIHTRKAQQMKFTKGLAHFDTIHEFDIVEELSSALHREYRLLEIEMEEDKEAHSLAWENEVIEKVYDM